jgi:hypothetical protein
MYSDSTQTLVLISSTILYHKAILTLKSPFCLKSNGILPLFVEDYEPNQNLKLFSTSFKLVFGHIPPPLLGGPHDMVFEHLNDLFSSRRFCKWVFPTICSRITHGHIYVHQCIAHVLRAICFLNMAKPSVGFVQFFLEKHYVTSLITPYAFNFMIHFKTFSPPPIGCHN